MLRPRSVATRTISSGCEAVAVHQRSIDGDEQPARCRVLVRKMIDRGLEATTRMRMNVVEFVVLAVIVVGHMAYRLFDKFRVMTSCAITWAGQSVVNLRAVIFGRVLDLLEARAAIDAGAGE